MKNTIYPMSKILEQHNLSLPEGARKANSGDKIEYHERWHALKVVFSKSHAFLIDSRAFNHMVSSKNNYIHQNIMMVHVFTWDMTRNSNLKGRFQSN